MILSIDDTNKLVPPYHGHANNIKESWVDSKIYDHLIFLYPVIVSDRYVLCDVMLLETLWGDRLMESELQ